MGTLPRGGLNRFYLARQCYAPWPHLGIIVASGMIEPGDSDMPREARFVKKPFRADVVYDHFQDLLLYEKKPEPLKQRATSP